jgi:hypothetical protein
MIEKRHKGWLNLNLTEPVDLDVDGRPVRLPKGCLGMCFIWESKAAFGRAGYKGTKNFRKVSWPVQQPKEGEE